MKPIIMILAGVSIAALTGCASAPSSSFSVSPSIIGNGSADIPGIASQVAGVLTPSPSTTIAVFSGSGPENTVPFTTPANWELSWWYSCPEQKGSFTVTEFSSTGDRDFSGVSVGELGTGKGPVETYAYDDAGRHYLDISSRCDWHVSVLS